MALSKPWRRVFWIAAVILLILLSVQVYAFFYLGPTLAGRLSKQIHEASQGVYWVESKDANLNLFNGSLVLRDFSMKPDTSRHRQLSQEGKATANLYHVEIPRLSIQGMSVYDALKTKKLDITRLQVERPEIQLVHQPLLKRAPTDSFRIKNLYSLTNGYLTSLSIANLEVRHGTFRFNPQRQFSQNAFAAREISLKIKNFQLDSAASFQVDRSFYAEEIELGVDIRNYSFVTPDSAYEIRIGNIGLSTTKNEAFASNIHVKPRFQKFATYRFEGKAIPPTAELEVPKLLLTGVDFGEIYFDRVVNLDGLKVDQPRLRLTGTQKEKPFATNRRPPSLYELYPKLKPYLKGISVNEVEVSQGEIWKKAMIDDTLHQASLQGIEISLRNFQLDSIAKQRLLQAEDIRLEVKKYDFRVGDDAYRINGKNLWLSTQSQFLLADSLRLIPGPNAMRASRGKPQVYEAFLPMLVIEGVDASRTYFERVLDVNKIHLGGPTFKLTNYPHVEREQVSELAQADFYDLISSSLNSLLVRDLELEEGEFLFNLDNDRSRNAFEAKDISVQVINFRLDSTTRKLAQQPFYADDISVQMNVQDYSIMAPDSNHQMTIGKLGISTQDSVIFAEGISVRPTPRARAIPDSLKPNLYEMDVPKFQLKGLSTLELYLEKTLSLQEVRIERPLVRFDTYAAYRKDTFAFQPENLHQLIADYISILSVDRLVLENGTYHQTIHSPDTSLGITLPAVWLELTEFWLDSMTVMGPDNLLFAKEIQAKVKGIQQNLDSLYVLQIGEWGLSTQERTFYMNGVELYSEDEDFILDNMYEATIPHLRIAGMEAYEAIVDRELNVDSILIQRPELMMTNYPVVQKEKLDSLAQSDLYSLISGYLKSLQVGSLQVADGSFKFRDEAEGLDRDFTADELSVQISNFRLDSAAQRQTNNPFYADDIAANLNINHYQFILPDSSYIFQAGRIGVSTGGAGIEVDSIRLIPLKVEGQGADVLIPRLQLAGVNIPDIYFGKTATLSSMRLIDPKVKLLQPLYQEGDSSHGKDIAQLLNPHIYPLISSFLTYLHIKEIEVQDTQVDAMLRDQVPLDLGSINLTLKHFELKEAYTAGDRKFFHSEHVELRAKDWRFGLPDSMYWVEVDEMGLMSCEDSFFVKGISLIPRYGMYEFGRAYGKVTDRIEMEVDLVGGKGLDIWRALTEQRFRASRFHVDGMAFDIFRDKKLPPDVFYHRRLPQRLVREFPYYIHVDSAFVNDGKVTYRERAEDGDIPGVVDLTHMWATVSNISNDSLFLSQNIETVIDGQARIMKSGNMRTRIRMVISDTSDTFSYTGILGKMDFTEFNPMAEPALNISIKDGLVKKVLFNATANRHEVRGRMRFYYNDLRIKVLKKNKDRSRGFTSFLANSFVVRGDNPNKRFLRIGKIYYERDSGRSIFNYWVKGLLSGVKSSVGTTSKLDRIKNLFRMPE